MTSDLSQELSQELSQVLAHLQEMVPMVSGATAVPITKGFSSDRKYQILCKSEETFLLRLFGVNELPGKQMEFAQLAELRNRGVNCTQPVAIGQAAESGYMLLSYMEGNDAIDELPLCTEQEQYAIGLQAGQELRKITSIPAPPDISPWYDRKRAKHERYMVAYATCGFRLSGDDKISEFINRHMELMRDRPNFFQHDDFHVSNLLVKDKRLSGVIDFGRCDWGDPVHEFVKAGIFSSEVSTAFSVGQIRGYLNGEEPDEDFWNLYAMYLGMTAFSSVVWTLRYHPHTFEEMLDKIYRFLEHHDYFADPIPSWYRQAPAYGGCE